MRAVARAAVTVAALVLLALPAGAEVKVEYDDGADFSGYATYAWRPGTDAPRPQAQAWIVAAVERQLAALGLKKATGETADLYVVTHAVAQLNPVTSANYIASVTYNIAFLSSDVVLATKGTLAVDLLDGKTNTLVWRGVASEVMTEPKPDKVHRKIDKLTAKMFKSFPKR